MKKISLIIFCIISGSMMMEAQTKAKRIFSYDLAKNDTIKVGDFHKANITCSDSTIKLVKFQMTGNVNGEVKEAVCNHGWDVANLKILSDILFSQKPGDVVYIENILAFDGIVTRKYPGFKLYIVK